MCKNKQIQKLIIMQRSLNLLQLLLFGHYYYWYFPTMVIIRLSQPSLAGVWAEFDNECTLQPLPDNTLLAVDAILYSATLEVGVSLSYVEQVVVGGDIGLH